MKGPKRIDRLVAEHAEICIYTNDRINVVVLP